MKCVFASLVTAVAALAVLIAGCSPAAPAPTQAPVAPAKAAEPTKAAAPAASTTAPAAPQPTAAPAKTAAFPEKGKAITMIIPWPAGGSTDVGGRLLAAAMEKDLGTPVQAVNKAGASSQIGVTDLVTSKADGYTVGMTNLPSSMVPYLDPERKAVYGRKDLVQVANQVVDPEVIAVKGDSSFKSLKDLVDAVKAKPGQIKVGTSGLMGDNHLALLLFQKEAGVKFDLVHFEGGPPAATALLGGHIDAICLTAGTIPQYFKSGEMRFLGIMDQQQSKFFPGVKTFEEQGYKVYYASARGISVPSGTPKDVVGVLSDSIKKAMQAPEMKQKMDDASLPLVYMDPAQYTAYWDDFEAKTKPLLQLAK